MILWRISNYPNLSGSGGLKVAGRWHHRGIPIVYLAESPALAMLEVLIHFEFAVSDVPDDYRLVEIVFTPAVSVSRLPNNTLAEGWQNDPQQTRYIGNEWVATNYSLLLKVPSAIVPHSFNYLLNPQHPDASEASIKSVTKHPYDRRLFVA